MRPGTQFPKTLTLSQVLASAFQYTVSLDLDTFPEFAARQLSEITIVKRVYSAIDIRKKLYMLSA